MIKILHVFKLPLVGLLLFVLSGCMKREDTSSSDYNVTTRTYSIVAWSYSPPNYFADLNVPDIVSENINNIGIMVYFRPSGTAVWYALPYTQYDSASNYFMGFNIGLSNVQITWTCISPSIEITDPNTYFSTTSQYKVVIIPAKARRLNPHVNYNNYEEVKATFDLKD